MKYRTSITKSKRGHYTAAVSGGLFMKRLLLVNKLPTAEEARRVASEFIAAQRDNKAA